MNRRYPSMMNVGRPLFLSIILALLGITYVFTRFQDQDKKALQLTGMLEGLKQYHFLPREIDDTFSKQVFGLYIESLDGYKRFFTQEDIDFLHKHETHIDDQINARTFEFYQDAVDRFNMAITRAEDWHLEILDKPMDFTIVENIETNPEKMKWAPNATALKDRWRLQLKYEVLYRLYEYLDEEIITDPEMEGFVAPPAEKPEETKTFEQLEKEAREAVKERYVGWFKRIKKSNGQEYFAEYLNSIAMQYDPHTQYFAPVDKANFDISMSNKLEGIGARLQTDKDDTKVMSIITGGPAWKQKELEVNDVIMKVAQADGDPVDVKGMDINEVVSMIRGKKGTEVRLTVRKVDGTTKVISIIREEVQLDESLAKSMIIQHDANPERIGYIRLPRFYADFESQDGRSCASDMAVELQKLKNEGVKGMVIDLRGNGGGSLRDVVTMTGYFIEKGPIVQVQGRGPRPSLHEDRDQTVLWDGPLIILVDEFSASASEIMAAALQDYGRAVIVGSNATFGKGTVQRFFDLDNAITGSNIHKPLGEVKMTIQKFYRINGGSTQLRGVIPDIILPTNYSKLEIGEKELKYAMPFSEIPPSSYDQQIYRADRQIEALKRNSDTRVSQQEHFRLVNENATRLRNQRDQTIYPLELQAYKSLLQDRKTASDRFKDIYAEKSNLQVYNPGQDLIAIQKDSTKIARNDDFKKNIRKDMHLHETLNIMVDMVRMDRQYVRSKEK